MAEVDKMRLRHSLLNESRTDIITSLKEKDRNISELDKKLPLINRSTLCYHLNILEGAGVLQSKYTIITAAHSKGKTARVFSINRDNLRKAIQAIDELKNELTI